MASSPASRARIAALDGVRGLALAAVLAYHVAPGSVHGGFLGVDVFFVLSGFLLGSLLLGEVARTGTVDRGAYAVRRVRRIMPALIAVLAAIAVVVPIVGPEDAYRLRPDVLWSLAGLTNWHLILEGTSYFDHLGRPIYVRHLWSIAIELQFYVVCPFLVAWLGLRRRAVAVAVLVAGIAASETAMAVLYASPDPSRAYFGTDTRASALLVGVLVAVLASGWGEAGPVALARAHRARAPLAIVALAVLAVLVAAADERSRLLYPAGFLAVEAATGLIILAALGESRLAAGLGWGPLRWLGQRSYGIYLWSWPVVTLLAHDRAQPWYPALAVPVAVGASLALGELSYRVVEQPWMRPAPRTGPSVWLAHGPQARLAAASLIGIVLAVTLMRPPTSDPIAESVARGQAAIASHRTHVLPQPTPTATPQPPAAPVAAAPTPIPTPAAQAVHVTAIGDSVMLGAAPALIDRLGDSLTIDAKVSRSFGAGLEVARTLARQGQLGRVVVVHLGNNGPIQQADMDAMLALLPPRGELFLLTVRVDVPWQGVVNQSLRDNYERHPSIWLIDWFAYSENHPEWFWSDGTHLRPEGASAYADLIVNAVRDISAADSMAPAGLPPVWGDHIRMLAARGASLSGRQAAIGVQGAQPDGIQDHDATVGGRHDAGPAQAAENCRDLAP